jgi:hypothetical protein
MDPQVAKPELFQPDIRWQEHRESAMFRIEQAVRGAGYSMATFSPTDDTGGAITATEIKQREKRSLTTRDRKIGYWTPELAAAIEALLAIDQKHFGAEVTVQKPQVEFPDAVTPDLTEVAATIKTLNEASAVSAKTKVEYLHQDWDEDRIEEEVTDLVGSDVERAAAGMNAVATLAANLGKAVGAGGVDEATATEIMQLVLSKAVGADGEPIDVGPTDFVGAAEREQQALRDQALELAAARSTPATAKPGTPGRAGASAGKPRPGGPAVKR